MVVGNIDVGSGLGSVGLMGEGFVFEYFDSVVLVKLVSGMLIDVRSNVLFFFSICILLFESI